MVADFEIRGADDFHRLAAELKQTGSRDLRRELFRGLDRVVKPLGETVRESLADYVPDAYAEALAATLTIKSRKRAGARNPAVSLVGSAQTSGGKERKLSALDQGRLRRPLFGNRRFWFDQQVRPGVWSEPLTQGAPRVRAEIELVLGDIRRKLERAIL